MSSIAEWQAAGLPTLTAWVLYLLGQVQRAQGGLDAAARTCRQALEMTAVPGRPPPPAAGPAYVGLGEVAYQRNELDTALRRITEGVELCRQFAYIPPLATGLVTLAWIRQASGDPGGALAAIAEAMQASPGPAGPLNPVPAQRARLLLAQGDLAAAARWTERSRAARRRRAVFPAGAGDTWSWSGSCWPRTGPSGRSRCWTGCTRRRPRRTGPAA